MSARVMTLSKAEPQPEQPQQSPLRKVRCPSCGGTNCGWDAYSVFNPVTGENELGGEYDAGWCNDCGDVEPEFYEPQGEERAELEQQIAEHRAKVALETATPYVLAALEAFLRAPSVGSSGPGSVTIEVQTFNLNAARAALAKAKGAP